MSDETTPTATTPSEAPGPERPDPGEDPNRGVGRVFLVIVDESPEMDVALRFACRRARHTGGRVALLYVTESSEFENWLTVGDLMRDEARHKGEQVLQRLAGKVNEWVGRMPILHLRDGSPRDQLFQLIEDEPDISILVLGAATGKGGPGPLVAALTGKYIGRLRVPVTIVPDSLASEEVDSLS
ncbi:universal stress protein [Algihabitans sp.]|uniref:universal stress protein n=1 Tax=Algihabitans sp. TaxID=2821514 RepID=UPI003BACFBB8